MKNTVKTKKMRIVAALLALVLIVGGVSVGVAFASEDPSLGYNDDLRILTVADVHNTYGPTLEEDPKANTINKYLGLVGNTMGWENEDRMQKFVDDVLYENYLDPLDALLVLGDLANTDQPFKWFWKNYESEIKGTAEDLWGGDVNAYMMDEYYRGEYDAIYNFKTQYLDQLTEAGIPYYVIPGNHDAYTPEMWSDCFGGEARDKDGNFVQASHIGATRDENGLYPTNYVVKIKETAFVMVDTFSALVDENGMPVAGFDKYFIGDTLNYTPIQNSVTRSDDSVYTTLASQYVDREAMFEALIEKANDLGAKNIYVCAHYFDGCENYKDKEATTVSDWQYVINAADKYGTLRGLLFGHNQVISQTFRTTDSGKKVVSHCSQHFVDTSASGYFYENGEQKLVFCSIADAPWGFSCIEHNAEEGTIYRIFVEATYEHDPESEDYYKMCGQGHNADYFHTPYEQPWHCDYTRSYHTTMFEMK